MLCSMMPGIPSLSPEAAPPPPPPPPPPAGGKFMFEQPIYEQIKNYYSLFFVRIFM